MPLHLQVLLGVGVGWGVGVGSPQWQRGSRLQGLSHPQGHSRQERVTHRGFPISRQHRHGHPGKHTGTRRVCPRRPVERLHWGALGIQWALLGQRRLDGDGLPGATRPAPAPAPAPRLGMEMACKGKSQSGEAPSPSSASGTPENSTISPSLQNKISPTTSGSHVDTLDELQVDQNACDLTALVHRPSPPEQSNGSARKATDDRSQWGTVGVPLPCDHDSPLSGPFLQSADAAHQIPSPEHTDATTPHVAAGASADGASWPCNAPTPTGAPAAATKSGGAHPLSLSVSVSPEIAAIALVYFVQGILGLSRLALTFFLKDDFSLDPAEVALLTGAATFPWLIKPLYGFISDTVPLFGFRRRSYLIGAGLLGAASWLCMATVVNDKYSALAMILLSSLGAAVSDVIVDSMVVARARGEPQSVSGSLQSLCWGSAAAGSVLSAYVSGSLVEHWGPRAVFGVTALLPLITTGVGFFVPEERSPLGPRHEQLLPSSRDGSPLVEEGSGAALGTPSVVQSLREQLLQLREVLGVKEILFPTLFIFFWQATPHSETAMFFYTTNVLGLGPEFLGRVRLVTAVASLAGVGLFNFGLRSQPLRRVFLWSNIVGTLLGSSQLILVWGLNRAWGVSDQFFLLGDSLILAVLGQISFMPVLVLAARVCPPGIEATLFASLMSISNGAGVVGGLIGAALTQALHVTSTDFDNLGVLLIICNFSSLLALPLLRLLPEGPEDPSENQAAQGKEQ